MLTVHTAQCEMKKHLGVGGWDRLPKEGEGGGKQKKKKIEPQDVVLNVVF